MAEELTSLEKALCRLMSDVSEDYWCAGWFSGIEYQIWAELHAYGSRRFNTDELEAIDALSKETGTWITWADGDASQRAVPLDEWKRMFAEYVGGTDGQ